MTEEERKAFKDDETAKRKKKRHDKQCGLIFPIIRIRKNLKHSVGVPVRRGALRHRNAGAIIKKDSAVFCAAVLEYIGKFPFDNIFLPIHIFCILICGLVLISKL